MRAVLIIAFTCAVYITHAQGTRGENPPPPPPPNSPVKQEVSKQPDSLGVYELLQVENLPEFPGGEENMYAYLRKNVMYPEMEREANVQGKVYVEFVIEIDGTVSNVRIRRGVSRGLDMEALRVVKRMPKWTPAKCNDKCVKVRYCLPINFKIT